MKILVLSDSHGSVNPMVDIVQLEQPDHILHLGDTGRDAERLMERVSVPCDYVSGNCDGFSLMPPTRVVTIGGKRIFMSHGHPYQVKSGYGAVIQAARQVEAHLVLFGHTHQREVQELPDGLWLMNPGACGGYGGSYGIITIEQEEIMCYTVLR